MSNQYLEPSQVRTFKAGGAITAYYFVEMSADNTVTVCNAATDRPVGVAQHAADSGAYVLVAMCGAGGTTKISSDAALSVNDLVGPSSDGQGDAKTPATDDNEYYCGIVTCASAAAGGMAELALCGPVYLDKNT